MGTNGFILAAITALAIPAIVISGFYFLAKSLIRYYFTLKNENQ